MTKAHSAFRDLVWPAAAGNVAWSFVNLALNGPWVVSASVWIDRGGELAARLAALLLLAWYLAAEWLELVQPSRPRPTVQNVVYWLGDGLLVLAIVVYANALAMPDAWTELLYGVLSAAFVVAAFWHLYNGWPEPEFRRWGLKCALNLAGLALVWIGYAVLPVANPWHMVSALFVVITLWSRLKLDLPAEKHDVVPDDPNGHG